MKKKTALILYVLRFLAFLIFMGVCIYYVNRTLKDKDNYLKYSLFYEEKENFDALFFGSSRMLNAILPMELWEDFGLTSYNMAQHGEASNLTYWQMKNAFRYNVPKVAVVDLSLVSARIIEEEDSEERSYLHKSVDHMPFGSLKYEALKSVTKDVDLLEYMFPIAIYHNRWNQLDANDFYLVPSRKKGAEGRVAITSMERGEWSNYDTMEVVDVEGSRLQDMIDLCREYDVELVFTCVPSLWISQNPGVCASMNFLAQYAQEQGVPFLNLAKNDEMMNYAVDFHDTSHVNPSGGKKVTKSIGAFLDEHYDFPEKTEETKKAWAEALDEYKWAKILDLEREKAAGNPQCYLMLLNDDDYTFHIRMRDENVVGAYGLSAVLEELKISESDISFDLEEDDIEIEVYDAQTGQSVNQATFKQ